MSSIPHFTSARRFRCSAVMSTAGNELVGSSPPYHMRRPAMASEKRVREMATCNFKSDSVVCGYCSILALLLCGIMR